MHFTIARFNCTSMVVYAGHSNRVLYISSKYDNFPQSRY